VPGGSKSGFGHLRNHEVDSSEPLDGVLRIEGILLHPPATTEFEPRGRGARASGTPVAPRNQLSKAVLPAAAFSPLTRCVHGNRLSTAVFPRDVIEVCR